MATTDIRLERARQEYVGLRDAQDGLMDRIDTYEAALLGLTEAVSRNGDRLDAIEQRTEAIEQRTEAIERRTEAIEDRLDSIIKHLKVPYKPQTGFIKD